MTKDIESATSKFSGLKFIGLPSVLVYAFLGTALSEEIFFRGFLAKRLINKLGFRTGNLIQGILFGLIHVVFMLLANISGTIILIIIGVFTGLIGWFMGYINEKMANGSILPGWIIHGFANTFSSIISLFSLI
jgi:membrane protease YdiL (CAAX protease family)